MSNSEMEQIATAITNNELPQLSPDVDSNSGSTTSTFGFRDVIKSFK